MIAKWKFFIFFLFITFFIHPLTQLDKLNQFINNNDIKQAQKILKRKINLNELDQSGFSPLYYAVMNDNIELINLLVQKGADINYKILLDKGGHNIGYSVLQKAVFSKKTSETIKILVELGANVNIISHRTDYQDYLIIDIIDYNDLDLIDTFIKNGADVNVTNGVRDDSAPIARALNNNNIEIAKMILNAYNDINQFNDLGMAPIHYVAGYEELLKIAIDNGADINLKNQYITYKSDGKSIAKTSPGFSPLHFAIQSKNLNTIKLLIENNAEIKDGEFIAAVCTNKIEIVKIIAENCSISDLKEILIGNQVIVNKAWLHPLYYAIKNNNIEMVKYLIKKGANVNWKDYWGKSLLTYAEDFKVKRYSQNKQYNEIITTLKKAILGSHEDLLEQIRKKYNNHILTDFIIALINKDISLLMKYIKNEVKYKAHFPGDKDYSIQETWNKEKIKKYLEDLIKEISKYDIDSIIDYIYLHKQNNKDVITFDNAPGYNWTHFYFVKTNNHFILNEIIFEQGL